MSEWSNYSLGDLAEITSSKRIFYSEYVDSGIPFYRSKEVINLFKREPVQTELFITHERFNEIESKFGVPNENDILLTSVGSLGIPYLVKASDKFYFKDGNLTWFRNIDKSLLDPKYLYIWLSSSIGKQKLDEVTIGSTQAALTISGLKTIEIELPPLPEQKAIASVLSSLDDKIDLLHRQNKTLEAMAETLFRQWFIEEAKEDWGEVPLSDYFKVKHGYAFKGEFITPEPTKYRLVTPGNFEIGGGFKSTKFKYYSSDVIPEDYVFDELDFVVTMTDLSKEGDTLGYPAFIPLHHKDEVLYLHNQRVGKMQFHNEKECKFFFYMLMKQDVYQQFIIGSCTGTSVKHTSPTTIGSFNFAKPPQERMWEFDRIVRQQFAKIFQNQKQIQTLEKLRNTLLPKLMSGEVRVQYQTEEVA